MDELKEKIENNSQQLKTLQENERAKSKVSTAAFCVEFSFPHSACAILFKLLPYSHNA